MKNLKKFDQNTGKKIEVFWSEYWWKIWKVSIRILVQLYDPTVLVNFYYSEVPIRRADRNKRAGFEKSAKLLAYLLSNPIRRADMNKRSGFEKSAKLLAYLLSKLINEQGGIFRLLHKKLRAGWEKNLSEHALLLGTSE